MDYILLKISLNEIIELCRKKKYLVLEDTSYLWGVLFAEFDKGNPQINDLITKIHVIYQGDSKFKEAVLKIVYENYIAEKLRNFEYIAKNSADYFHLLELIYVVYKHFLKDSDIELFLRDKIKFIEKLVNFNGNEDLEENLMLGYKIITSEMNFGKYDHLRNEYMYYEILKIIYNKYIEMSKNPKQKNIYDYLKKYYRDKQIDFNYDRYELISIKDDFELGISSPSRIHDKTNNLTIYNIEVCNTLHSIFEYLLENYSLDLALKPNVVNFDYGIRTEMSLKEEIERGVQFAFKNLDFPSITKLYSNSYDNLWINIETGKENQITFEEIVNDDDVEDDGEFYITQIIHLKYLNKGGEYLITHIDHEYIFYDINEYEDRKNNPFQHGEGREKIKTFKIDNAEIPFKDDKYFYLYEILSCKFKNLELLNEYFQNVISNPN